MCFRFQQNGRGDYMSKEELEVIAEYLGITLGIEELPAAFKPASNIALTDPALVVTNEVPRKAEMLRFSIIPFNNTRDPKKIAPNLMGNATKEKVAVSPMWKGSFERRRCLIPVSGFYDWVTLEDGKTKVPYMAYVPGQAMFCLTGIWDRWISPAGEEVRSFAIITGPPNELWAKVHNRMPVIMPEDHFEEWLSPENPDLKALHDLLAVYPSESMAFREFSRAVNSSRNKDESTLEPIGEQVTI